MCRMFAVRSLEPVPVLRAFAALKRLATEHKDGWGIARFDGHAPWVETSITSATNCARFGTLAQELSTTSLLAHIRLASVGAVTEENSHPFFADGWAFMHNGTLQNFDAQRERFEGLLAPARCAALRGATDSERCFALFLTLLQGRAALADVTRSLVGVVRAVEAMFSDASMNFIVSDGQRLVATRRGRTLYTASRPGTRFIASEHLWEGEDWVSVPENGVVAIDRDLSVTQTSVDDWG